MLLPTPPRQPGVMGRPRKHGGELALSDPATWPDPQVATSTMTSRYEMAAATARDRVHPRLTHRAAWLDRDGDLPVIEGTLIHLQIDRLPGDRDPEPVWLWFSGTGATPGQVDRCWQAFLRRFDLEHTFRFFKQTLGWAVPKIRDPATADRWTWLIIAAYAQLRLARALAADLRLSWERPAPAGRLTPARVRRGSRTSARPQAARPVHRNPANQAQAGRRGRRTATRPPATTWEKRRRENSRSRHDANAQVKRQAEMLLSPLGPRWSHVQQVGEQARRIAHVVPPTDRTCWLRQLICMMLAMLPTWRRPG